MATPLASMARRLEQLGEKKGRLPERLVDAGNIAPHKEQNPITSAQDVRRSGISCENDFRRVSSSDTRCSDERFAHVAGRSLAFSWAHRARECCGTAPPCENASPR